MPEYKTKHEWVVRIDAAEAYGSAETEGLARHWARRWKRAHPDAKVTVQHVETCTTITKHDPVEITNA